MAAAAASATSVFSAAAPGREPQPAAGKPLGKIALEEHFLTPDFMDYFAETYQNINPKLIKMAPEALMDFGERRLKAMDENHVDLSVLGLADRACRRRRTPPWPSAGQRL